MHKFTVSGLLRLLCAIALPWVSLGVAHSQAYPDRAIRMVIAYPVGGGTDVIGRLFSKHFSETIGQPVIVDNRPGAFGTIGANIVANAPADGYTLLFTAVGELSITEQFMAKVPYTMADFTPISRVAQSPFVIMANPKLDVSSLPELVALAQQKPKSLYISAPATYTFLTSKLFTIDADVDMEIAQYKGSAPAMIDLVGGHVLVGLDTVAVSRPMIQSQKVRPLAVAGRERSAFLPDVPTTAESGLPTVIGGVSYGLVGPAQLSATVKQKIDDAVRTVLNSPSYLESLKANGFEPVVGDSSTNFAAFIQSEAEKWTAVASKVGFKVE